MIKSFTITNHLGKSIFLELRKPEDTGFLISSVTGLGPVTAEIAQSNIATIDGSMIGNVRLEPRNIVFTIVYYEDNKEKLSIEQLRHNLYVYFPVKREITIDVENDSRHYVIKGTVESNELNIFSKQEGSQISIVCPDPYFEEAHQTDSYLSFVTPNFQFPCSFEADIRNMPAHIDQAYMEAEYVETVDGRRLYKYPGPFRVYSLPHEDSELFTENMYFDENLTVAQIPYDETPNDAGGTTVDIASGLTDNTMNDPYHYVTDNTQVDVFNFDYLNPEILDVPDYNQNVQNEYASFSENQVYLEETTAVIQEIAEIIQQYTVEFGIIKDFPSTILTYDGDDGDGFILTIEARYGSASGFRINRVNGGEYIIIDHDKLAKICGADIQKADYITIDTRRGKKTATLSRAGKEYNILHALKMSAKWLYLDKGENEFTFTAEEGRENLRVYVRYMTRFNGV